MTERVCVCERERQRERERESGNVFSMNKTTELQINGNLRRERDKVRERG